MVNTLSVAAVAASLLLFPSVNAAGDIYSKNSPVLQVDAKSYASLIANSNHTSIVEFYAPWCGHCQNLKPAYEKAAKSLSGLAKVAAVNCDEESNKPLCGSMGVKGFPTLKIVRPGKKAGRPNVEDYQGPRSAKGIVDAVKDKIPNHVKKVTDKGLDAWLGESGAKAALFTEKGTTSALLKALAVDYLGSISVAQIRDKETNAVSALGVTSYPTFLLLPDGAKDPTIYDGEMTKEAMSKFLSQVAAPNPDPAPKPAKASKSSKSKDPKKSKSASSAFSKASASHESADSAASQATQTAETLEEDGLPTESPNPNVVTEDSQKPVKLPEPAPMIPFLSTEEELQQACLTRKSGTCVLALRVKIDADSSAIADQARTSLAEIHHRHVSGGHKLFPFYSVAVDAGEALRSALSIADSEGFVMVATNAKRQWVRKFTGKDVDIATVESWVDDIRMGDGRKEPLPEGLLVEVAAAPPPAEETVVVEKDPLLDVEFEELTPEMEEQMLQHAREAAKKREEEDGHDEL